MDKESQLVLTANGHLMGERFDNRGTLHLSVQFANGAGRRAATVAIMEGVPGRNGTVTQLSSSASTTITPAPSARTSTTPRSPRTTATSCGRRRSGSPSRPARAAATPRCLP
jgi:hypothetical protein